MEEKIKEIQKLSKELLNDLKYYKLYSRTFKSILNSEKTFDMGIFQGSKSKAFSIAKKLIIKGFSVEEVSSITDLTTFEIKNFIDYN